MTSETQSVYFMDYTWTPSMARAWLKKHNLHPIKHVERNGHQLRYRIHDPSQYKRFATKELGNDIYLVLGI